ncbi:MAG: hypothetical protein VXX86_04785 [Planctomycetota bacterium]|nr:hypothetical protein [Planctomycetota bacterium]
MAPLINPRSAKNDHDVRVGWRMAGLASETISYVLAGGLLGGVAEDALGGDLWLPVGFGLGILTGIAVLIRGALRLNRAMDRERARKRFQRSDKGDLTSQDRRP